VNTVHYGKRKLSLRKILSETFVRCILVPSEKRQSGADIEADLIIPKIHIVVPYLKIDPDQVDQGDVVTGGDLEAVPKKSEETNTSVLWPAQAIISLTATRSKPPVSAQAYKESWKPDPRTLLLNCY
jgi:hypothetical protein